VLTPPGIADGMEYQLAAVRYALERRRIENCVETHPVWGQSRCRRQVSPGLRRALIRIDYSVKCRGHAIRGEGVAVPGFRRVLMLLGQLLRCHNRMSAARPFLLRHSHRFRLSSAVRGGRTSFRVRAGRLMAATRHGSKFVQILNMDVIYITTLTCSAIVCTSHREPVDSHCPGAKRSSMLSHLS
jgi:hypothetical protein